MPIINHHNLMSLKGEDDLHWEQCVRLLLINPVSQLLNLQTYVNKIIKNILENPSEEKFLKLKHNNSVLQKNIFSVNGGLELILSIGFQFELDPVTTEKYLVFPLLPLLNLNKNEAFQKKQPLVEEADVEVERSEYMRRLQLCEEWLANTIATCLQFQQSKSSNSSVFQRAPKNDLDEVPADSLIQLQLPTGKVVIGGFMKGDLGFDIWKFACSYFTPDRHELVEFRLPYESTPISKDAYSLTIEELQFFPRTKFIVFALDPSQVDTMKLAKSHESSIERFQVDKKKRYEEIQKRKAQKAAEEELRLKTLKAFKDDRVDKKLMKSAVVQGGELSSLAKEDSNEKST